MGIKGVKPSLIDLSCRGLDSYIVGGISRGRDFLLVLVRFSFAVSVTSYAFPTTPV